MFLWLFVLPSPSPGQLGEDGGGNTGTTIESTIQSIDESAETFTGVTRSTRIIGGSEAEEDAWPFMAALIEAGKSPYDGQFCGGALIDPKWVVTAAHCTIDDDGSFTVPRDIEVILGIHDLKNDPDYERFKVERIIRHPSYNLLTTDDADIALLELVDSASSHTPIIYVTGSNTYDGILSTVIGWGTTSATGKVYPERLQQVTLPIVTNAVCDTAYGGSQITENMLCAGFSDGGKDSCQGDSGGPLVIEEQETSKLVGIVSWGTGCAQPGYYGVYARVTRLTDFIELYVHQSTAPEAVTGAATDIENSTAVLHGTVNPNGIDTTFQFEYGTTEAYGSITAKEPAGSESADIAISTSISGLSSMTTYHYRIVTSNDSGTVMGADKIFTTPGIPIAPTVTTTPAASITSRSAVLNGIVNPHGLATMYYFEYREGLSDWIKGQEKDVGLGTNTLSVTHPLTDLSPGTTYLYRIGAVNAVGTSIGTEVSFATAVAQPPNAVDDIATTATDTAVTIDVLANDTDPDGDDLTIIAVSDPPNGTANISDDGKTVSYEPDSMFNGSDTFTYTISDGDGTAGAEIMISVGEGCSSFAGTDASLVIPDGHPSGITSTILVKTGGTVTDVNLTLSIDHQWVGDVKAILVSPTGIQVTLFDGVGGSGENFSETILDDEADQSISLGTAPFRGSFQPNDPLSVFDGINLSGDWNLTVIDQAAFDEGRLRNWSLEICYAPVTGNQAPVAENDAVSTLRDTPVVIDALANDHDVNGDALSLVSVTDPPNGTAVVIPEKTIRYSPDSRFIGKDTFSYTIDDGKGETDTALVTVSVRENTLLQDGSFEVGSPNPFWNDSSDLFAGSLYQGGFAHTGEWFVWFAGGNDGGGAEAATISQSTMIPAADSASLKFWLWALWWDVPAEFSVMLDGQVVFTSSREQASSYKQWTEVSVDVSRFADGNTHEISFETNIESGDLSTDIFIDDISLAVGAIKADLDGDGIAGIADLILALRIITGLDTSDSLRTGYATSGADADGDGQPGLAEAIHILRQISGE